ncbi:bifunctional tetrahydrofolate synthase/dihydrofolate synthase [Modicisalibacter luteus]|uniref:Dihydrofolate synthase/folylpolyglutamate synthase n=1 Tax=Modicisalibacter luteus TaxID=453962 RepID=A0ABV7M1E0_9GAMM|nr:bifunctional tetrahydrofolate synthase/dihydrofolate synthase [Halomonas lutea]GHA92756.1 bifunctional folylpolyglutamate synthase/dihydrofolate synthase [Halomonas lutea]
MSDASLKDWLTRLERQHPVSIDLGLERVAEVACRMGLLDSPIAKRIITVAGTNGKGSTVAMLESLGRAHGLSTATYTSPHLLRYNERLRLDGVEAEDRLLVDGFERVEAARLAPEPVSLTYFEAGTLAAFWAIAQRRPELAILEVGLGGRLDAVNVIDPDVAVITTIAQDHAAFLGTDLEQIGREKAGIMRRMRPVVLGSERLPSSVRQVALAVGAGIHGLGEDFRHSDETGVEGSWAWEGRDGHGNPTTLMRLPDPQLPRDNAASALQALYLADVTLDNEACRRGFADVQLPGRMQWLGKWCLDVAHNPHAAHYLASRLAQRVPPARRIGLLGMLGDKDATGVVAALSPQVDGWVAVSLEGERARSASELAVLLESHGQAVLHQAPSPAAGAEWLMQVLDEEDEALVCGSFFTVAGVLEWFSMRRVDAAHEPASTARRKT